MLEYQDLIREAKKNEGIEDPILYALLKKLEGEAKAIEKEIRDLDEKTAELTKNRHELKKVIVDIQNSPDSFTPHQIDALIINIGDENDKGELLVESI